MPSNGQRYNVGGVILERPFKIRRLGHFGFNMEKIEEGREFYGDLLGFKVSDLADFSRAPWFPKDYAGPQGYFMRYGTDHHAMMLFAKAIGQDVALLNDADAAGVAEMTFGAGKGVPGTVLMLTFGTGVGSALFTGGLLVRNTEFGQPPCRVKSWVAVM